MLVDVEFKRPDPVMGMLLTVGASTPGPLIPERIGEGMYLAGHWNVENVTATPIRDRWKERDGQGHHDPNFFLDFEEYGVCDDPEQPVEKFGLRERPERFFVACVEIRRADQPRGDGWRWHKWGDYIGTRQPQCEYLHDEPEIERVYTFQVYELAEAPDPAMSSTGKQE